jgi:hypothetical protein
VTHMNALFTTLQHILIYSVCAVVWATLAAGLYQLVHDKLRHVHWIHKKPSRLLQGQRVN